MSLGYCPFKKMLEPRGHSEKFLRDWLVSADDIPSIQVTLRDFTPRTAQKLTNRIANRLSDKSNTAGSVFVNYESSLESV